MIRLVLALYLALCGVASAQLAGGLQFPGPGTAHSTGTTYTGPGDIQASGIVHWAGLRAYSTATRGNRVAQVCTTISTVDTCVDMNSDATTGMIVLTTIGGLTCNNSTVLCNVKNLYDQSGALKCSGATACDWTEPSVALRPSLITSCLGALPCMGFVRASSSALGITGLAAAVSQPISTSVVANRTGSTTSISGMHGLGGPNFQRQMAFDTTNRVYIFGGSGNVNSATVSNNAWHAFQGVFNGSSSLVNLDGVDGSTANGGSDGLDTATTSVFGQDRFNDFLDGSMVEIGAWSVSFTTTGVSASMSSNQHTAWGF